MPSLVKLLANWDLKGGESCVHLPIISIQLEKLHLRGERDGFESPLLIYAHEAAQPLNRCRVL